MAGSAPSGKSWYGLFRHPYGEAGMAEEPWQKAIKDLKSDFGKAKKDMAEVDKQLATGKRSLDLDFLDVHKRLRRLKRGHANLDRRLTVTSTRLDRELADINKR